MTTGTALVGTQQTTRDAVCAGLGPLPGPKPTIILMVRFGLFTPHGHGTDSDFMHHQYRLWNPGPARKNPTQILPAVRGRFHAVILQEPSDHAPLVPDQFIANTGGTDHAILLNRNTLEPDAAVFAFHEASTSKVTWGMVVLVVPGFLRRPSLSCTSTVTFCSVHLHNVVAKKRDASTDLL